MGCFFSKKEINKSEIVDIEENNKFIDNIKYNYTLKNNFKPVDVYSIEYNGPDKLF